MRVRARARHESGTMNKLEAKYAGHLEELKMVGEIVKYKFEAFKLRLAKATFYDFDFEVIKPDGLIEIHEVKGRWEDDARVKIKVAAEMFPEFLFIGVKWDRKEGWQYEKFGV